MGRPRPGAGARTERFDVPVSGPLFHVAAEILHAEHAVAARMRADGRWTGGARPTRALIEERHGVRARRRAAPRKRHGQRPARRILPFELAGQALLRVAAVGFRAAPADARHG